MTQPKQKYLDTATKFVEILEHLNKIDDKIETKIINNEKDIKFINNLQNNTSKYCSIIIENLKIKDAL